MSDYTPSEVYPGLFVGEKPPEDHPLVRFSTLVYCAAEYQPAIVAFKGTRWRVRLYDNECSQPEEEKAAIRAGRQITKRILAGQRVLVTCWGGLNRSAFVAGLAMLHAEYMTASNPMAYEDVAERIRATHTTAALGNPRFIRLLRDYQHTLWTREPASQTG